MICKQKQVDQNPISATYNQERIIDVPCPPNTPCSDAVTCSGSISTVLSCLPSGQIKVIINSSLTGLKYRFNGSVWQDQNEFILSSIPATGYLAEIYQISSGCIKSVTSGTISCSMSQLTQLVYVRTVYNYYYCPNSTTVFAIETVDVYFNSVTNQEEFKVVGIEGQGTC